MKTKRQAIDEVDECVGGAPERCFAIAEVAAERDGDAVSATQPARAADGSAFPAPTVLLPSRSSVPSDACSKNRTCSATSPSIRRNIV